MPLRHTSFLWQMYTKFREEYMEARSAQLLLGDVADAATGAAAAPKAEGAADAAGQAAGGAAGGALAAVRALTPRGAGAGRVGLSSGTDPITGDTCARIELTAHGHDFGVQIFVPPSAVGDGIRKRWIRAETVIQAQVDYFADGTGGLGQALSPTVCVDIEPTSSGTPTSLAGDYTAVFPLCIGSCMDDRSEIAKGDLALCFGRWQTGEWLEIEESNFELLPPRKMDRYGCEMPFCAVRLPGLGWCAPFRGTTTASHGCACAAPPTCPAACLISSCTGCASTSATLSPTSWRASRCASSTTAAPSCAVASPMSLSFPTGRD